MVNEWFNNMPNLSVNLAIDVHMQRSISGFVGRSRIRSQFLSTVSFPLIPQYVSVISDFRAMPADGDGNGRFSAAASRVCIYWPGESSGIIFDVELSLPGLTYFVPVVWMETGLQQDQCLFQHWVVSESLQRHWAGNETEVRLTVKTGAVNWRNVPLFFHNRAWACFSLREK